MIDGISGYIIFSSGKIQMISRSDFVVQVNFRDATKEDLPILARIISTTEAWTCYGTDYKRKESSVAALAVTSRFLINAHNYDIILLWI